MAYITALSSGPANTLVQNQTYAAPPSARLCVVQGSGMEWSNDNSTWAAVTLDANNSFLVGSKFIRSTASGTIVTLKQ